jgi:hypothetical protein
MNEEKFLISISKCCEQEKLPGFTGLGIILCDDLDSLPISPLLTSSNSLKMFSSESEIIKFLFQISNVNDKRHDGFHIVKLKSKSVLFSQYFSPQLPPNFKSLIYNVGARYRTAQLGSLYENIKAIITVNQHCEIYVFRNGHMDKF